MESAVLCQSPPFLSRNTDFLSAKSFHSYGFIKRLCLISPINHKLKKRAFLKIRETRGEIKALIYSSSESSSQLAPLQLESPVGQFLWQILLSHPHLVPAAVDQQLDQLLTNLESEKRPEETNPSCSELILYRRIAELKAKERKKTLEEILYALVVQKFIDANLPMVPSVSHSSNPTSKTGRWTSSEEMYRGVHSPEAFKMIENHLSVVMGNGLEDSNSVASIGKHRVGQVYATSILYGYFLKRVDRRFQLDKIMKTVPCGLEEEQESPAIASSSHCSLPEDFADRIKPCRLRAYVMSFDSDILKRFASVRSKEAFSIIDKHTEALFGRPGIVTKLREAIDSSSDELIRLSFSDFKRLILEAVTFGSFVWDVECYVDSRYHFVAV